MLVPNAIIRTPTVQHQGPGDCGVFAIAFATSLTFKINPCEKKI